ncbi:MULTISPECIES: diaminopropionate ammonia-lyase [Halomonas]|uniref:diaminopropionate ammonia-lyase n=1 Tax=Halomonas TaxID=2745 RepID=UPI001C96AAAB|nr:MULTISPECIES: diaminopropionate ammonia-lyase [Halomonas]MBY6206215.1 diaminopropionate ammonia-lyase [Halomonas sp. DP3Y7-2]MBY6227894.1 diaminopropionate ammonia-lyase [Halomonas sp. DP3Y7-1]MCA0915961.1 diaminopropionate ammonia-lyase [Halomonas denitrificans]
MSSLIHQTRWRHVANPRRTTDTLIGERQRAVLNPQALHIAQTEIRRWPGYAPTPLVGLDGLAKACGVAVIDYKDEAERFSLKSFKALGGAYAVLRLIKRRLGEAVTSDALMRGEYRTALEGLTVCCATDGNHGRSVAWGASQFGVRCVIYLHATVSEGREQAIADFGAEIRRVPGNYDDSVRQAAEDAAEYGWCVVSDTSYPGYMDVPRDVMQGYSVMVDEAVAQMRQPPTHCFVQGGVGGLAAATLAQLWEAYGAERPRLVVVEPERAACLLASAEAGRPVAVEGELDTLMAGLACGEVSLLAWEVLDEGVDDYVAVSDEAAVEVMQLLAAGVAGDSPLVAGESAVAGLAGLLIAQQDPELGARLGLTAESRVLLIGSEGATDDDVYRELVGSSADEVRSGQFRAREVGHVS